MKLKELMETKPGTILVLPGRELEIVKVVKYKGATDGWINLVSLSSSGREKLLEIEDRKVRDWREISELLLDAETMAPITRIETDVVIWIPQPGLRLGNRFELCEGPSRANTVTITEKGTEEGKLKFAVFCPKGDEESDERICIEDKGGRLVVYYSTGYVPVKEIRAK